MTIRYLPGENILYSPANVLVCPVNCRAGFMDAGLAKAFADRWPGLKDVHARAVRMGFLAPGYGHLVWMHVGNSEPIPGRPDPFGVYLFPTKDDWWKPSQIEWIKDGLEGLTEVAAQLNYHAIGHPRSIAVPMLGCGLGRLKWTDVRPLIERASARVPGVEWLVYGPGGQGR